MSALGGVLFVDEAYTLNTGYVYGKEATATLTNLMTEYKGYCCVILAGYEEPMNKMMRETNPGLRERFPFKLIFDDYSAVELMEILKRKLEDSRLRVSSEGMQTVQYLLDKLYKNRGEEYSNARVVENIYQEVVLQQERRLFQTHISTAGLTKGKLFSITKADCEAASRIILAASANQQNKMRTIGFTEG